jgi:hypothetical protein
MLAYGTDGQVWPCIYASEGHSHLLLETDDQK